MGRVFETKWTENQVRTLLETENFALQNIDLPYGLSTGGKDCSWSLSRIFPTDLSGKSVLDIGTRHGYFCFEALKRGADRVVGVDVDPQNIRKAKTLADCLGAEVEFLQFDIERDNLSDKFDYVLCLSVLQQLRNPIGSLDKVIDHTEERLILEIASHYQPHHKRIGLSLLQRHMLNKAPIIFVDRNGTAGRGRHTQKYFMNIPAVENLLLHHRKMFARVDSFASEDEKGRFVTIGYKRRIKRLVIVAGPTRSGKSTLLEKIKTNSIPAIARAAGIEGKAELEYVDANGLVGHFKENVDTLIFHYDIVRPFRRSAKTYYRDEALDLLDTAENIVILTLYTPPDILRRQYEKTKISSKMKQGKRAKDKKRYLKVLQFYADNHQIYEFYNTWINFWQARKPNANHLIVQLQPDLNIISASKWTEFAAGAKLGPPKRGPIEHS